MPSKVITTLNQLIRADLTAAEINAAANGFAGLSLPRLGGQRIKLWGLIWGVYIGALADRVNAEVVISLQKGLILNQNTALPAEEIPAQMIFSYPAYLNTGEPQPWFPAKPLVLEPGDSYALFVRLAPYAAFAAGANLYLTVFGEAEPVSPSADMTL